MKVSFTCLPDFIAEFQGQGQNVVRAVLLTRKKQERPSVIWVEFITLITTVIPNWPSDRIAEVRVPYGKAPLVKGSPSQKYKQLLQKAERQHSGIERRLRDAGFVVFKGAFMPDADILEAEAGVDPLPFSGESIAPRPGPTRSEPVSGRMTSHPCAQ